MAKFKAVYLIALALWCLFSASVSAERSRVEVSDTQQLCESAVQKGRRGPKPFANSKDEIAEILAYLSEHFSDLSRTELAKYPERFEEVIQQKYRRSLSSERLYRLALAQFDNWLEALEYARVPNIEFYQRKEPVKWSHEFVVEVIEYLAPHFPDLSMERLYAEDEKVAELTFKKYKRVIHAATLKAKSQIYSGGWATAIEQSTISNKEATLRKCRMLWSKDEVKRVLKFLDKHFKNLSYLRLLLEHERMSDLTYGEFKRWISAKALYKAATIHFGSWFNALKKSGLSTESIKIDVRNVNWTPDLVKSILHFLSQKRVNLHWDKFLLNNVRVRELTYAEMGRPLTSYSIIMAARAVFGSYKKAVEAAGVPWAFGERVDDGQGAVRTASVALRGVEESKGRRHVEFEVIDSSVSPEQALIDREEESVVETSIAALAVSERRLCLLLLEYLEEHDNLDNQRDVLKFLRDSGLRGVSWPTVERALQNLSSYLSEEEAA